MQSIPPVVYVDEAIDFEGDRWVESGMKRRDGEGG